MVSESEIMSMLKRAKARYDVRAKEDVVNALKNFTDLLPDVRKHKFPDGQEKLCFMLHGTVPIHYKGSTYHIPVALYFTDNHPYNGPFCYVTPTATMKIKASQTVDDKGRIYLPYLTEWRFPGYDTTGLLQVMTIAFQDKCPVFSVSASSKTTTANSSTPSAYPTPNVAPYPSGGAAPYPSAGSHAAPYPSANSHMPMPPSTYPGPQPNATPYPSNVGSYQPPYQPYVNIPSATPTPPLTADNKMGSGYSFGTIQPSHIRASLITAIEERIRQRLREKIGMLPFFQETGDPTTFRYHLRGDAIRRY
jgi:ESCRT-I complex subunit TSG101